MTFKKFGSWGLLIGVLLLVGLHEWISLLTFLCGAYLAACVMLKKA